MFALVKFEDSTYYVCQSSNVTVNKGIYEVKYSNNCEYSAVIIAKNDNKKVLQEILKNVEKCKPYIKCERLKVEENDPKNKIHTKITHKQGYNYKINAMRTINEINEDNQFSVKEEDSDYQENIDIPQFCDKPIHNYDIRAGDIKHAYGNYEVNINQQNHYQDNTDSLFYDLIDIKDIPIIKKEHENVNNVTKEIEDDNDIVDELNNYQKTTDVTISCGNKVDTLYNDNLLFNTANKCTYNMNKDDNQGIANIQVKKIISSIPNNFELKNARICLKRLNSTVMNGDKEIIEDSEYLSSRNERGSSDNEPFPKKHKVNVTITRLSTSVPDTLQTNSSGCNDENMYVDKSNVKSKQNCCIFCMKSQSKLVRHLEKIHADEPEVKKFAILPKRSLKRKKIIDTMRKNGNFKYNLNATVNKGQLIVCRRPNKKSNKTATDFVACMKCKGFFAKSSIRHHARECFKQNFSRFKGIMVMGRKITCRIHKLANDTLRNIVFPVLRDDEVTRAIRYDELIILYANKLCVKYRAQHQHDVIRSRLRLLGRLLLTLRKINNDIDDFKSLYYPKFYDNCVSAINVVARYNDNEKIYETPTVAINLSILIKDVGNLLITECIKQEDTEKKKLIKDFLKLLTVDGRTSINTTIAETQLIHNNKRHTKIQLPSLEDIKTLYKHLKNKRVETYIALKQSFSINNWLSLAEATLITVHIINKRQVNEIERVLIEDFRNYKKLNKNMYSNIYTSLSTQNRKIAERYIRFYVRGKLGRRLPILLSHDLFECINLILKFREEAKVSKKNPYVFGLPDIMKCRV
ncbi:PREDICTED: uncharacterized protein LOC108767291 [Trachymyrmex cornetzi]|uniref:uncharacterized protein LOC108767291 n=1 Tax=Trachymyrmex cornetzi TaxID=471704 RepID=UPI00084F2406|nr:PREDICTED: uncharacterized protein LOC108767291 [Trachymyrmex cornetzi]